MNRSSIVLNYPFQSLHLNSVDSKEKEKVDADGIYEYGCLTLSLGLLLRDGDDAVKEGDGERLSRV